MGYSVVDPDDCETVADRPCELRRLSDAAELTAMAINYFRAEPGEQLPLAYHSHETQEEAFVVLSGPMHVETPVGEYEVPEGQLFAATPTEPHRAYNPADAEDAIEVVAIGAPPVDSDANPYEPEA